MSFFLIYLGVACRAQPEAESIAETSTPSTPTVRTSATATVQPPTPTATSAIETGADELDGIQIVFWHPWTNAIEETIANLVLEFNTENSYGIQVEYESHSERLNQDLRSAAGLGTAPHVVAAYPQQINGWRTFSDLTIDIHSYTEDPIWGLDSAETQDMVVPAGPGLPLIASAYYIFYNHTWAEELGFENPPDSLDAFKEQACAASAQRDDGRGGWIVNTQPSGLLSWIYAFGGNVTNAQGEYRFESAEMESAFTYLHGLLDTGCAWVSSETYPNQAFAGRQALFYESSLAGIPYQVDAFEEAGNPDEWILIPYPVENGEPVTVMYDYQLALLRAAPPEELAAWIFAGWLAEPSQQARLAEAGLRLPTRLQTVDLLEDSNTPDQWQQALGVLANSRSEPVQASWEDIRWALGDAADQLFAAGTTAEDIPEILTQLQMVAEEIQALTP